MSRSATRQRSDLSKDRGHIPRPARSLERQDVRPGYNWPELRIVRETSIVRPEQPEWDAFLSKMGRKVRGKGNVRSLGSMAMTYVSAVEFGIMLQSEYPKAYEKRDSTIDLLRKYAEEFNAFVRKEELAGYQAEQMVRERQLVALESDSEEAILRRLEIEEADEYDIVLGGADEGMPLTDWRMGTFAVNGLDTYGSHKLGLDLSGSEQLQEEFNIVRKFFRRSRLNHRVIDDTREPHITFLDTFGAVGALALRIPNYPTKIVLDAPVADVNLN